MQEINKLETSLDYYCHLLLRRERLNQLRLSFWRLKNGHFYNCANGYSHSHFEEKKYHHFYEHGHQLYETAGEMIQRSYRRHIRPLKKELNLRHRWDSLWRPVAIFQDGAIVASHKEFTDRQKEYIMNTIILGYEVSDPFAEQIKYLETQLQEFKKLIEPTRKKILEQHRKEKNRGKKL